MSGPDRQELGSRFVAPSHAVLCHEIKHLHVSQHALHCQPQILCDLAAPFLPLSLPSSGGFQSTSHCCSSPPSPPGLPHQGQAQHIREMGPKLSPGFFPMPVLTGSPPPLPQTNTHTLSHHPFLIAHHLYLFEGIPLRC